MIGISHVSLTMYMCVCLCVCLWPRKQLCAHTHIHLGLRHKCVCTHTHRPRRYIYICLHIQMFIEKHRQITLPLYILIHISTHNRCQRWALQQVSYRAIKPYTSSSPIRHLHPSCFIRHVDACCKLCHVYPWCVMCDADDVSCVMRHVLLGQADMGMQVVGQQDVRCSDVRCLFGQQDVRCLGNKMWCKTCSCMWGRSIVASQCMPWSLMHAMIIWSWHAMIKGCMHHQGLQPSHLQPSHVCLSSLSALSPCRLPLLCVYVSLTTNSLLCVSQPSLVCPSLVCLSSLTPPFVLPNRCVPNESLVASNSQSFSSRL